MKGELTEEEIEAAKANGIIMQNWYAVFEHGDKTPCAIFKDQTDAEEYRFNNILADRMESWPMVIK